MTRQTVFSLDRTTRIPLAHHTRWRSASQMPNGGLLEGQVVANTKEAGNAAPTAAAHEQSAAGNPVEFGFASVRPALAAVLREELARRYRCVPIEVDSETLVVATPRPLGLKWLRALELATGRRVAARLAAESEVQDAFFYLYRAREVVDYHLKRIAGSERGSIAPQTRVTPRMPVLDGTRDMQWAHLFQLLVWDALEKGARELRFEIGGNFLSVHHVADESVAQTFSLPGWLGPHLLHWWTEEYGGQEEASVQVSFAGRMHSVLGAVVEFSPTRVLCVRLSDSKRSRFTKPHSSSRTGAQAHRAQHRTAGCPRCQATISAGTVLCPRCHAPVRRLCRMCGMRLSYGHEVCPCCSTAATPVTAATTAAPLAPTGHPLRERPVGAPPPPPHVLVVDDQPEVRLCTTAALRSHSFQISTAGSGEEALEMIREQPPHIIVLDMIMPGMDGAEVLEHLRASVHTAFIPVVAVTVLDPDDPRILNALGPADACLQKPVRRWDLLACVQQLVRRNYRIALESTQNRSARDPEENPSCESRKAK